MSFFRFAVSFCLMQAALLQSQGIITTVVGHATVFPVSGLPARSVSIGADYLAVGPDGSIFIIDKLGQRIFKVSPSGSLTVVVGNGLAGYSGDGGPATAASLFYPSGLAVDAAGALYISDSGNNRIRKVSPNGVITTIAGADTYNLITGLVPATTIGLNQPTGLALGPDGSLYIADTNHSRILKLTTNGLITSVAGGSTGYSGFSGDGGPASNAFLAFPSGIATDSAGALYIADTNNFRIRKVTPDGVISTIAGTGVQGNTGDGGPAVNATLGVPTALAVDAAGAVFIGDSTNQNIRKIAVDGSISTVAGGGTADPRVVRPALGAFVGALTGIAVDSAGTLLIADSAYGLVQKLNSDGTIATVVGDVARGYSGDGGPAAISGLSNPTGIAVDASGALYIPDPNNSRVRKVTPGGIITTIAGTGIFGDSGDGGPATSANLSSPYQVALDAAGALYIADRYASRVRKVSPNGIITTVAGNGTFGFSGDGGPAVNAALFQPYSVAVDGSGSLFIADCYNRRVRKVNSAGIITTVAGNGSFENTLENGIATEISLGNVSGVAVDASGTLYFTDPQKGAVRKVSPAGMMTKVAGAPSSGGGGPRAIDAGLDYPAGVAVDAAGVLYIAQANGAYIRKVDLDGNISTVAGNGYGSYSGDGGPAIRASLHSPNAIAIDAAGTVYIADSGNNSIRKVSPGGPTLLSVYPLSISLQAHSGSAVNDNTAIQVHSSTPNTPFQVATNVPWMGVLNASTAETMFFVAPNATYLAPGVYSASITISIPGHADAEAQTVSVTLTVDPAPPLLSVPNTSVKFNVTQRDSPVSQTILLKNTGGSPLPFNITTIAPQPWLTISPASGTIAPGESADLQVSIAPGAMAVGSYYVPFQVNATSVTAQITVTAAGSNTTPPSSALGFVPLPSCRVLDTRTPGSATVLGGPAISAGTARILALATTNCGIPANVAAYSLNLTVVPQGPLPYVTLWPTGQQQPQVSTLNSFDGRIKANAAIVPAGADGSVSIYAANTTDAIVDINGYFLQPAGATVLAFYPLTPCRITDTRSGSGAFAGPAMAAGETRTFPVPASPCGVPANAQAYSLNMTVVPNGPLGYLTAWAAGLPQPLASTLNAPSGAVTANAAIVPAGPAGAINVYAANPTGLIIDINGYFAPPGAPGALSFYAVAPCRIADTRGSVGPFGGPPLQTGESRPYSPAASACPIPSAARAFSLNATVIPQQTLGFLTLWPGDQTRPTVSTLNSFDGSINANAAIVPASAKGIVSGYASNATDLILDINGYFAP